MPNPEGLTYREYIDQLSQEEDLGEEEVAALIAATKLLSEAKNPLARVDVKKLNKQARMIQNNPSFEKMMEDPQTVEDAKERKGTELAQKLGQLEEQRRAEILARYKRPLEVRKEDEIFLQGAIDALEVMPTKGGKTLAKREKKNKAFKKMLAALKEAKADAAMGTGLSPEEAKKLTDAVREYNDAGGEIPGGPKKSKAFNEAMCILNRFAPKEEFVQYCEDINQEHPNLNIDPATFTPARMRGEVTTARDLRDTFIKSINLKKPKAEDYAKLAALYSLSRGDDNAMISGAEVEQESQELLAPGSAFRRLMKDEETREVIDGLLKRKNWDQVSAKIMAESTAHALKTAQRHLNRSVDALTRNRNVRYFDDEHLANILAINATSRNANPKQKINNLGFQERADRIRKDPAFRRLADRYASDPRFRERVNNDLKNDRTGGMLALEYQRIKNPALGRQRQNQNGQVNPQVQPGNQPVQPGNLQNQPVQPGNLQNQPVNPVQPPVQPEVRIPVPNQQQPQMQVQINVQAP